MLNYYGISRDDIFSSKNSKIESKEQRYNKKNKLNKNPSRYSKFTTLSSSSSQKKYLYNDNYKKSYSKDKYNINKSNRIGNGIINYNNYPYGEEKVNLKINKFLFAKDPNETLYKNSPLISNSYNILSNNLYNNISSNKYTDHVSDLLNYGNREPLYNYIGKKGFKNSDILSLNNSNRRNIIKENISKDELTEYHNSNCWSVIEYSYKEEANEHFREYMEDKAKSIDGFNNDNNIGVFCIFDGHGGREVSTYLQKNIVNYLKEYCSDYDNMENNLINLFEVIDQNFCTDYYSHIGSTACIVYITKENGQKCFYCANIGDTRCILIHKDGVKRISYDDRATDKNEINRVKNAGGIIFGGRVYGQLMLTRAFGDNELKKYGVICKPHVSKTELNMGDKYIIIASDGVWDALDDNEVYSLSLIVKNSKELCDIIVKNAIDKGSMDNISCFVIKIN